MTKRPVRRALKRDAAKPRGTPDGYLPGSTISRLAGFQPSSYDAASHSVDAVFSTGAEVRRWGIVEVLAVTPESVNLARVALGQVPCLDTHDQYALDKVLGTVIDARIVSGQLIGRIKFGDTPQAQIAEGMVARGELRGISVGYNVAAWSLQAVRDNTEIWQADKWELMEVSLVAVPADPYAGIRSASAASATEAAASHQENDDMKRNASTPAAAPAAPAAAAAVSEQPAPATAAVTRVADPAAPAASAAPAAAAPAPTPANIESTADATRAERTRIGAIHDIGRQAALDAQTVTSAVDRGISVEAFRAEAFNVLASRSAATRIVPQVAVITDETETRRRGMTEAMMIRIAGGARGEVPEHARAYVGMSFAEMAATCVGHTGHLRSARAVEDVVTRAFHSTSDFPGIFQDAMNRRLLDRYQAATPTYRRFAAPYTNADFRPQNVVRAGDFPALQLVNEAGEIKQGTFSESKEVLRVYPYAVGFNITRQMIINDNLGAIEQVLGSAATRVADWENAKVFALLASNPSLATDSVAVFHATHGNLAGSGSAIDVTSVGAGRAAMMAQKSLDGILINLTPALLLCGPGYLTAAEQLVATITPAQISAAVPDTFKKLAVAGDANIGNNNWYLFADPSNAPCFVYGGLEGFAAPRLTTEAKFGVQGIGVQLEHDFGCAAMDFRGGYKNAGA